LYKDDLEIVLRHGKYDQSTLLVLFPFILRPYEDSDLEISAQGTYRTMNSLISENKQRLNSTIGKDKVEMLQTYFSEGSSLRNSICHATDAIKIREIDAKALTGLFLYLLSLLRKIDHQESIFTPLEMLEIAEERCKSDS
jgi:hypothetical protein